MNQENKKENLQALKNFFETDMKIKETLISLSPSELDDVNESSRIEYVDKLNKGLKTLKREFLSSIEKFKFEPEVDNAISKYFEKAEENFLIGKYEPGICKELYSSQFSNMKVQFIEEVKKGCVGGYPIKENSKLVKLIQDANTANELLHAIHTYIANNNYILQGMPIISEKKNNIGENITLYGEENEIAQNIFDKFPLELDCGLTDIIALQNKVLMMVRDRGHALTIDMDTSRPNEIETRYFMPTLYNKEKVEKLPGINKSGITESGATGFFISSKDKITIDLFDFIEKVPTDADMVINLPSFNKEDVKEIVFESGKEGRKLSKINLIQQKIKNAKTKIKEKFKGIGDK